MFTPASEYIIASLLLDTLRFQDERNYTKKADRIDSLHQGKRVLMLRR